MAKSMTGYGRSRMLINGRDISFEIKAVNNRFLDINIKLGRLYNPLEDRIKQLVRKYTTRGKIDVYLSIDNINGEKTDLTINREYLESYLKQLEIIKRDFSVDGEVSIGLIANKSEIFIAKKTDEDIESVWADVEVAAKQALDEFVTMRIAEGEKLKDDILNRIASLEVLRQSIMLLAPKTVKDANQKMIERIKELLGAMPVDESRLLTECAVYADKSDITEELVRLGSHFSQLSELMNKDAIIGKTVDFLLQETNREINTIGSKSSNTAIARIVVDAKSELEKIREQIQNIE
ncbi:MAG: YicC/YloC family endoribonuclease [Clostridia bacterium]